MVAEVVPAFGLFVAVDETAGLIVGLIVVDADIEVGLIVGVGVGVVGFRVRRGAIERAA